MYEVIKEFTAIRNKTVHRGRMVRNGTSYSVALTSSENGRIINLDQYQAQGYYDALTFFNRKWGKYNA